VRQLNRLPQNIQVGKLGTIEEIRQLYVDLLNATMTQKNLERSRLDVAVKILAGASNLLQIDAMKELTDILLQLEGQGNAVLVLNSLKQARRRPLPGPPV
jgi:sulfopyruvate decarboxylase TPP-binding subunit